MTEYQQRVKDEKAKLDEKLEKLRAFFRSLAADKLGIDHLDLLRRQLEVMAVYSDLLQQRIELFERENQE